LKFPVLSPGIPEAARPGLWDTEFNSTGLWGSTMNTEHTTRIVSQT
jgi:hypothetical protein